MLHETDMGYTTPVPTHEDVILQRLFYEYLKGWVYSASSIHRCIHATLQSSGDWSVESLITPARDCDRQSYKDSQSREDLSIVPGGD